MKKIKDDTFISIKKAGVVLFWLILWQIGAWIVNLPLILPDPYDVIVKLFELIGTKEFYKDAAYTIYRCIMGMIISFVLGGGFALLSKRYSFMRSLLSPAVNFLKSTSVMAIIIYALLLLTANQVPVFVCFMMCFPIVYINILSGLDNVKKEYLEMAQVYEIERRDIMRFIFLPSIAPEIKASLVIIAGLSWKSVVAAEVLSVPTHSMGYNLLNAKVYFETDELFSWIIAIVLFSYFFEKLVVRLISFLDEKSYGGTKVFKKEVFKNVETDKKDCAYTFFKGYQEDVALSDVYKSFDGQKVLEDFSLVVHKDQVTALMGPSGKGKTTILRLIAGLEKPDMGEVKRPYEKVSYLFQEDRLLPWLNIYDNIALVLKNTMDFEEANMRIRKIIKDMGLEPDMNKLPSQLSGGMRRRVAMARAFLYPAEILLLDEPFKGLDEELREKIISCCFTDYIKNRGVLLVTHRPGEAKDLAARSIII
ncbi:MAG: ATP-binding cassette domain-containing protein [Anaerovoracaceae bacterium]|nr:ATP-binding cassette domain-containing protein [Clostridiales bacterium]